MEAQKILPKHKNPHDLSLGDWRSLSIPGEKDRSHVVGFMMARFAGRTAAANIRRRWYPTLVPVRTCTVSFADAERVRHSVNVQAETLYEAVALAVRVFREHGIAPGQNSQIDVEARSPSVKHTVALSKVQDWLQSSAKSPKDKLVKERLKGLLAS